MTSLQLRGYIAEWFQCFPVAVEGPKGCLPAPEISCEVGELGTPKLAQILAFSNWLYPYIMLLHEASDLDQRCLKTRNSEDECTFPPNIFAPTPKITPKTPYWGTFQCGPIIQRALRQSDVNVATTLKLYGYICIGKYLGCIKIFPLGDVWGAHVVKYSLRVQKKFSLGGVQGCRDPNVNPPNISDTAKIRK